MSALPSGRISSVEAIGRDDSLDWSIGHWPEGTPWGWEPTLLLCCTESGVFCVVYMGDLTRRSLVDECIKTESDITQMKS